jgi:hypothetical protein
MRINTFLCLILAISAGSSTGSSTGDFSSVRVARSSDQMSKLNEVCRKILSVTFPLAQELLNYSAKARESVLGKKIISSSLLTCDEISQKYIVDTGLDLLENQSQKVGALVSLKSSDSPSMAIVEGLKLTTTPDLFTKTFVFRPTGASKEQILASLSELIFVERTGIILGSTSILEGEAVEKYIRGLMTVYLGLSDYHAPNNPWYFNATPGSDVLVSGILSRLSAAKVSKIAVLAPETATETLSELTEKSAASGIQLVKQATYTPKNFDSLEKAVKDILQLNVEGREKEFKELVKSKTLEAETNGQVFKVENVRLPPIQNFDFLVLPDDFKMVRHIIKMFKFHGVSNIKIAGNHLWRSETLISPWDNLLRQSFFVDFIGSYLELPFKVDPPPQNPLFLLGAQASQVDFKLLGYRAGGIAVSALKFADSRHRVWSRALLETPIEQLGFGKSVAFNSKRKITWPVRYFVPTQKGVILLPLAGVPNKISKNIGP